MPDCMYKLMLLHSDFLLLAYAVQSINKIKKIYINIYKLMYNSQADSGVGRYL